jgi:hypothetical protein
VTRLLDRKSIAAANVAFVLIVLVNTMLWIVKPMMSKSVSTVVEITRHHAVLSATSSVKQYSERKNQTADVAMIESVDNCPSMILRLLLILKLLKTQLTQTVIYSWMLRLWS